MKNSLPLALAVMMLSAAPVMAADLGADVNANINPSSNGVGASASTNLYAQLNKDNGLQNQTQTGVEVKTEQTDIDHSSQTKTKVEPSSKPGTYPSKSSADEVKTDIQASGESSTNVQKLFSMFKKENAPQVEATAKTGVDVEAPAQK